MAEKDHGVENRRIARNTLYLYLRTLISIGVNIVSIRIVWEALGIDDYGIYNVVAGVVALFQFLNTAMVGASQRYLSYAIGEDSEEKKISIFSASVQVHTILAVIVLILSETLGLWLLDTKINLPPGREVAGMWVYQASVISMILMILSVPFNASIVANEDMGIYGVYGILEVLMKFAVTLLLLVVGTDRLITYSVLLLLVSVVMIILYVRFSIKHYPDLRYSGKIKNRKLIREMFGYGGWTMIGSFAVSARDQGLNVILNMFYNVAYNAAKGIANQVSGVVMGFTYNFQMSMFPQITKRYARGEYSSMMRLIINGCLLSYYLMLVISVPLFLRAEYVLTLWLKTGITTETVNYLRITLIALLADCMKGPVIAGIQATGRVRDFQLMVFFVLCSALPMAWIWLKTDMNPYSVVYVVLITNILALAGRFWLLKKEVGFHGEGRNLLGALVRIAVSTLVVSIPVYMVDVYFPQTFIGLVLLCLCSLVFSLAVIYMIGLGTDARGMITNMVRDQIRKRSGRVH